MISPHFSKTLKKAAGFILINVIILIWATRYIGGCSCDGGGDTPAMHVTCVGAKVASDSVDDHTKECCNPDNDYAKFKDEVASQLALCQKCQPTACPHDTQTAASGSSTRLNAMDIRAGDMKSQANNATSVGLGSPSTTSLGPEVNLSAATAVTDPSKKGSNQTGSSTISQGIAKKMEDKNDANSGSLQDKRRSGKNSAMTNDSSDGLKFSETHSARSIASATVGSGFAGQNAEAPADAYSVGNGKPSGRSGSGGFGFGGTGSIGESAGTSGTLDLGSGSGSNEVVPISDPADYFTRIPLDTSLFKIVHQRYESVNMRWINENSKANLH